MTDGVEAAAATTPAEIEIGDDPTALYRLYGSGAKVLYVGVTNNPGARMERHAAEQPWWGEVTRRTMAWYPTLAAAAAAETRALAAEKPRYNKQVNSNAVPRRSRDEGILERYAAGEWVEILPGQRRTRRKMPGNYGWP